MRTRVILAAIASSFVFGCSPPNAQNQASAPSASAPAEQQAATISIPDAMPASIFNQMLTSHELVGHPGLAWRKRVITVAFNGGSDPLYALIEQGAQEWTSQGGQLSFSFRENGHYRQWSPSDVDPAADIRVAFAGGANGGYWSTVGVLADNVDAGLPTLNLEAFPTKLAPYFNGQNGAAWLQSYEHTVVLHEFGHALGLSHEHFNAQCQRDLKLPEAIASLMGPPNNWKENQARFNMDRSYYLQVLAERAGPHDTRPLDSTATDQASVMLYSFNDSFYRSGAASPCRPSGPLHYATTLSSGDHHFFMDNYAHINPTF
jgi:hypothetical protein